MDKRVDSVDLTKLAMTMVGMSMANNAAKTTGAAQGQFQKLLEQHAKPAEKRPVQDQSVQEKDDGTAQQPEQSDPVTQKPAAEEKPQEAEEKPQEDPLEQVKKLAEQGAVFVQPAEGAVWIDVNQQTGEVRGVYEADEYIVAYVGGKKELIPTVNLQPEQRDELNRILDQAAQVPDASDPEADAMLEATDPSVDHSLGKVLERVVDEQTGNVAGQAMEEAAAVPQQEDDDPQVELLNVEQGPKPLFQDVKAPPIKVAESYDAQQAQDVNEQIAAQIIPAMEQGQTKVELQLTPEHLGTVKVEITQSENGALHVAISAQSSQTRNLLEKHTDSLQNLLASRSQNTVQVEVQRQEESQPKNPYDGHNGQHPQQQQQEHHSRRSPDSQDFIHQLRLGLVDAEDEG